MDFTQIPNLNLQMVQNKLQHKIKERKKKSILYGLLDEDDPGIAYM